MKTIAVQVLVPNSFQLPENYEVKIIEKTPKFKKGDVITNGPFIAIYEKGEYSAIANKFKVYYNTVYNINSNLFNINTIECGIGYENDCRFSNNVEKRILLTALQLEVENNTDKAKDAIKILKEVFDIEVVLPIRTYQDLIDQKISINGYYLGVNGNIMQYNTIASKNIKDVATSEKIAKSMLAMAMISQLIPYYGGEITDKEWQDINIEKYCIIRNSNKIDTIVYNKVYTFLAFHTQNQRYEFIKHNRQLIKDYLMIE